MDDLDDLATIYRDPDVRRYFPEGTLTSEETREELEWIIDVYYNRYGFGLWATIYKETGAFIGRCGLLPWTTIIGQDGGPALSAASEHPLGPARTEVEVAYLLAKGYWGQGLGTEAAQAVVDYGFEQLHLPRLICLFDPANRASARVAGNIGMTFERDVELDGELVPLHAISSERARELRGSLGLRLSVSPRSRRIPWTLWRIVTARASLISTHAFHILIPLTSYPPAIAPTIKRGSAPFSTASGNGASGDS